MITKRKISLALATTLAAVTLYGPTVQAHHSFAMYDMKVLKVFTGVVTRIDTAPNHLQIYFAPMNAEHNNVERDAAGEPIVWAVEMTGSAQMARQGVSVNSFPPGTVFSVALHPLRNGETAGTRQGGLFQCPERMPPAPGMYCDSVAGHIAIGDEPLALVAE